MAAVTITMSGDDARLRAAHERLLRDQQKILDKYSQLGSATKKLSEEDQRAMAVKARVTEAEKKYQTVLQQGKKLTESMATPQEVFNASIKEAIALKDKGVISADTLARKYKQLKQDLRDATGETKRLKDAESDEEKAKAKAEATTKRYMTTLEKLRVDLSEVKKQYDQGRVSLQTLERAQASVNEEQKKLTEGAGGGFDKAVTGLASYAAGALSAATAVRVIQAAWKQVNDEQNAGLNALKGTQDADRNLLQISGSAAEFTANRNQSDALALATGVDRTAVRQVMFQGISEGFKDAVPEIVASSQVVNPADAAGVAGQVPALFKGSIGSMEAVSMTLKAAELSRLDFGPLARALPQAVEGAAVAKAAPEETMATLSVLASRFKSGDTAADRIKMFASKVGIDQGDAGGTGRASLAGTGIIKAAEKLQAMPEAQRRQFLGDSQELNTAYLAITEELGKIKQQEGELKQERAARAAGGGVLRERVGIAANDPEMIALKNEAIAQQKLLITQAGVSGTPGAIASGAGASAKADLLRNDGIVTRMAGAVTTPVAAGLAAESGFSQEGARGVATGTARGITGGAYAGLPAGPMGFALAYNMAVFNELPGLIRSLTTKIDNDQAGKTQLEAAKLQKEAASARQPLIPAARAQASMAGQ